MKDVRKEDDIFHLDLEEVNILPKVADDGKLQAKAFNVTIKNSQRFQELGTKAPC